ncbi:MAG TPA: organomercurial lyase [Pyrinomonadaceae bacterium]|jgi:hypothetical protein|nr:organomercurial lyase [Pyrinomonadaceae bacterium]
MDADPEKISLDARVRRHVYDQVIGEGLPPTIAETARALARTTDEVKLSFRRLADAHILVLQKEGEEILMAAPFSAVPTPFPVTVGERRYYANCIWDALGIPSMLKQDAVIDASCGCCGTAMRLEVGGGGGGGGSLLAQDMGGRAHFAVPAARWWDDIVFS